MTFNYSYYYCKSDPPALMTMDVMKECAGHPQYQLDRSEGQRFLPDGAVSPRLNCSQSAATICTLCTQWAAESVALNLLV